MLSNLDSANFFQKIELFNNLVIFTEPIRYMMPEITEIIDIILKARTVTLVS